MDEIRNNELLPDEMMNKSLTLSDENLFVGFEDELLIDILSSETYRKLSNLSYLNDVTPSIKRIFISQETEPRLFRSMFILNIAEKEMLMNSHPLSSKLQDIVFPQFRPTLRDIEVQRNLLAKPDITVAGINVKWPNRALKNWMRKSLDKRNVINIGIMGLGRIGFELAKTLLACAYLNQNERLGFNFGSLNIFANRPKLGKLIELEHIANPEGRQIVNCASCDELFEISDVILFIASDAVPSLSITDEAQGDVRFMQFDYNLNTLKSALECAKKADFCGQLIVVSDPPEHLSTAVNTAISHKVSVNKSSDERIGNHQIPALAGRLNWARALHIIRETRNQELIQCFLDEGAVFGPHGHGAVVADSIYSYNRDLSQQFSSRLGRINYEVRQAGKLPYDAPGVNLALNLIELLRGDFSPVSLHFRGMTLGVYGRFDKKFGCYEAKPYIGASRDLVADVLQSGNAIRSATELATGTKDLETRIPMRASSFWANGVITGDAVPTRIFPTCSGRSITNFRSIVIEPYHLSKKQGVLFLPDINMIKNMAEGVLSYFDADYQIKSPLDIGHENSNPSFIDKVAEPNEFAEKAAIVTIGRINNIDSFNLDRYREQYPLYLEIEIDVDIPTNCALIKQSIDQGGICLGFTPQVFDKKTLRKRSARLHFGFFGDNIKVEECPETPFLSSIIGHEKAMRVFRNWKSCFRSIIDKVGPENCGKSYRDSRIDLQRRKIETTPILKEVLLSDAHYYLAPSLFEHILDVAETANDLLRILTVEDIDKDILHLMCVFHDIGKAIYINLNHYVNSNRLQQSKIDAIHRFIIPISEEELADHVWKYGFYYDDLLKGRLVKLPPELENFKRFIDEESGFVERDNVIAHEIIEESPILKMMPILKEKLRAFVNPDAKFEDDSYLLITELADNLSDFGRMDDFTDISRYLDYKEKYVMHRYGFTPEIQQNIRVKFERLRNCGVKLMRKQIRV